MVEIKIGDIVKCGLKHCDCVTKVNRGVYVVKDIDSDSIWATVEGIVNRVEEYLVLEEVKLIKNKELGKLLYG